MQDHRYTQCQGRWWCEGETAIHSYQCVPGRVGTNYSQSRTVFLHSVKGSTSDTSIAGSLFLWSKNKSIVLMTYPLDYKTLPSTTRRFPRLQDASLKYKTLPSNKRHFPRLWDTSRLQDTSFDYKTLPSTTRWFPQLQDTSLNYKTLPSITRHFPLL